MLLLLLYVDANGVAANSHLNRFAQPPIIHSHSRPLHFVYLNLHAYRRLPHTQSQYSSIFTTAKPFDIIKPPGYRPGRRGAAGGFLRRAGGGGGGGRESPYQVLGVSPSATPIDIKRAYRKLALKYHPDVNKDPGAQEKFMRIKHAYNTLLQSKSRADAPSDKSYSQSSRTSTSPRDEEDFYGLGEFIRDVQLSLGDFFRDVQEEFRNWETNTSAQEKPKSLWEELSEIGEEFVEFLEKELNITDSGDNSEFSREGSEKDNTGADPGRSNTKNDDRVNSINENDIDEIEATLARLKKELGL